MNPRTLFKSELIRNTSVLVSGTVLAQLISVLLQPLLRRLFPAEMWGTYSVYLSLVGIIAVFSSLRYDDAIVLPRKDKDSASVLALSLVFNLVITFIIFLIFLIFGKQILIAVNLKPGFTSSVLFLVPFGAFLYNVAQSFNYWLIRKKKYTEVSANKLIRRGSEGLSQVSLAFLKNPAGLIYSDIVGQMANVISTVIQSFRNGFSLKLISRNKLKYVASKYSEFPRYNLIPALMSTCSFFLPPVFINKFYSPESAGYFDLTKMVLSIPLAFVASSISSVLLQRVADNFNAKKSFITELKSTLLVVLGISLAESIIILLFGVPLFKFVFGQDWGVSGAISRIMIWSFVLNFIVSSFSCIFISMRKIKYYSIWQLCYFMAIISLLLFRNYEFTEFLRVYVLIEVVCYLAVLTMMFRLVINYEKNLPVV